MHRGGFSWNRLLGITAAKRRVSMTTGIPWTRSGRERKVGSLFINLLKSILGMRRKHVSNLD